LINSTGVGTLGRVAQLKRVEEPITYDSHITLLRPDPTKINLEYFGYAIGFKQNEIELLGEGSTGQTELKRELLTEIEIPVPPIQIHKKIVEIISSLDAKIELNRQMNQTLEAMAHAIFKSWFVDFDPVYAKMEGRDYPLPPEIMDLFPEELEESELGLIPKGWRVGTVGDIAENPKNVVHPNEVNEATYYVGLEHMPRKNIALDTWDYSEKVTSNKYAFSKGNILFGKLRPYFHKVGITPVDGICSTDIIVVNGKDNDYQNLLLFLLSSTVFVNSVSAASTGTKMPRTDWKYMQSYEIPLPPEIILKKFNSIVKSMVEKIVLNIHTSKNLENFRDVLLPKLIKGELDL
jgi:type I restriction enzyme S subunit